LPQESTTVEEESRSSSRESAEPNPSAIILWTYYVVLALGAVALIVLMPDLQTAGVVALAVIAALAPIALKRETSQGSSSADTHEIKRGFVQLRKSLETLVHEGGLSEAAKRVLHRREERELLRSAIEQDIADEDWEAAMVLVRELAERFGYRADADEFRTRIEHARAETLDRRVSDAITHFEELLRSGQWAAAHQEAARIERLFPDSHRVDTLVARVGEAKQQYKLDLQRSFLHAAQRDEIDTAMKLLKQLDDYLTEDEVEKLREVARGVVGKALDNLGARFKLLIEDKEWAQAVEVGQRLIKDFPNTRMADEVHEMLDVLRERAKQISSSAGAS